MKKLLPHLFLRELPSSEKFMHVGSRGRPENLPERATQQHAAHLRKQLEQAWNDALKQHAERRAVSHSTLHGLHIDVISEPGYELAITSLEDRRYGIRVANVARLENQDGTKVVSATVYVPTEHRHRLLAKIDDYANKVTKSARPQNNALIAGIADMRRSILESFWRDDLTKIPAGTTAVWCEAWIRTEAPTQRAREVVDNTPDGYVRELAVLCARLDISIQDRALHFPQRSVVLIKATHEQLTELIADSSNISELRRAVEPSTFFLDLKNDEQAEWVKELASRIEVSPNPAVAVCILDTGVNNGHLLLRNLIATEDCHSVKREEWGIHDHDGHGTAMSGVCAFGDLKPHLESNAPLHVNHAIESAKILPPRTAASTRPELYGNYTKEAVSLAEIQAPTRKRVICMAVTAPDALNNGHPTSWSAAIDQLTSGAEDGYPRLFIVSAGNLFGNECSEAYPRRNLAQGTQDPAQAWNALTVGAYTEKAWFQNPKMPEHLPIAQPGELSPFSTTSASWNPEWPSKPDIVLEGGNAIQGRDGVESAHEDLSLLTVHHEPTTRQFDCFNATSAATAQAAQMAAQIQTQYPEAWPETIRALMIHSADWTPQLKRQYLSLDYPDNCDRELSKTEYGKLLRFCGYGVPNLARALNSASNSLTLIAEGEIQPFKQRSKSECHLNEMHLYQMPWPREVLEQLEETNVTLRVTLSYFIEPSPGEIGWGSRYGYPSHLLRFELNSPEETSDQFRIRINKKARADGETKETSSGSERWRIGEARRKGSIHSDIWTGEAAKIAACNIIAVHPVGGWWKNRAWRGNGDRTARYSLVVSLHTAEQEVDIYTPVAAKIATPVKVKVEV